MAFSAEEMDAYASILARKKQRPAAHHAIEGQDEAPLGIVLGGRTVATVPPALQVLEAIVREVQHRPLVRCDLPAAAAGHVAGQTSLQ